MTGFIKFVANLIRKVNWELKNYKYWRQVNFYFSIFYSKAHEKTNNTNDTLKVKSRLKTVYELSVQTSVDLWGNKIFHKILHLANTVLIFMLAAVPQQCFSLDIHVIFS